MRLWRVVLGSLAVSWIHCSTWCDRAELELEIDWIAYWLVLTSFWFALAIAWEMSAARGDKVDVMIPYRIGVLIWVVASWDNTVVEGGGCIIVGPSQLEIGSAVLAPLWSAALAAYDVVVAETRASAVRRVLAYHLLACVALAVAAAHAATPWSQQLYLPYVSLWIAVAISAACLLAARHRGILRQSLRTPPPIPVARAIDHHARRRPLRSATRPGLFGRKRGAISAGGARSPRA